MTAVTLFLCRLQVEAASLPFCESSDPDTTLTGRPGCSNTHWSSESVLWNLLNPSSLWPNSSFDKKTQAGQLLTAECVVCSKILRVFIKHGRAPQSFLAAVIFRIDFLRHWLWCRFPCRHAVHQITRTLKTLQRKHAAAPQWTGLWFTEGNRSVSHYVSRL